MSELQAELHKTRRELQAARRALEWRYVHSQPITFEITVAALTAVLNHCVPPALAEAQSDRARLAEQLRIECAHSCEARRTPTATSATRFGGSPKRESRERSGPWTCSKMWCERLKIRTTTTTGMAKAAKYH
jgi:hypothetical protein